ncbi:FdhF/YdeP family oxidoreductase [Acidocella facilis]|uniref:FdhF/YdeP family oxidoreductase n=1 Tax=Acidocella facilis TaxID=525 RepID=UPI0009DF9147|nr:FdhF/YdeP family oxidoreductase [Acidocella facilis]
MPELLTHPKTPEMPRQVAGFKSESWPASSRNGGRHQIGIPGRLPSESAVFYTSGRASLGTSYLYSLFARAYGTNNLPDSSNMCHEATSVVLTKSIGVPVGTVTLEDCEHTDLIFFFGQNTGTNSPRMLHQLEDARRRGVQIITFNPLRERSLERFENPKSPAEMLIKPATLISTQYHQLMIGGDAAALMGLCKAVIEMDDNAQAMGSARVIDHEFIEDHCAGFDKFAAAAREYDWDDIVRRSGLSRTAIEAAAVVYTRAPRAMACYGMGLTQHKNGVETIQLLVNLLLLRGNIGRRGTGICPVRGHSNVQGQRTVGISEKPELVPLDRLEAQYRFAAPRKKGLNIIEACEALVNGKLQAVFQLGGNLVRSVPDRARIEPAWRELPLSVSIATKLNRNHLIHGKIGYILPCLGRSEEDIQPSGPQAVSVEDSIACIHGSRGRRPPASPNLLSETRIIAGLAKATLAPNPLMDWAGWADDYSRIRTALGETYPEIFHDMERRMWLPGGFPRPIKARERIWQTESQRANFITPEGLKEDPHPQDSHRDVFRMMTLRSNDQFNTTIYGYNDRFRGIKGTRMVVLLNRDDMIRLGIDEGDMLMLETVWDDGIERKMSGFRATGYDIPPGCCATYYPEANALMPLSHYAAGSFTPAAKSIPIRVIKLSN